MIVHIVFWRFHEHSANGKSKQDNALELKRRLEALRGAIAGLVRCEVGLDVSKTDDSGDIAFYSAFESKAALDAYQIHPAHKDLLGFLKDVRIERRVVDYEI